MADENGTEATRPDDPSVDDRLAAPVEGEDANGRDEQDPQGSDVAAAVKPQEAQNSGDAGEPADDEAKAAADEPAQPEDIKVVVSIKGGRAIIGVQKLTADPHIETFEDRELSELAEEVLAVTERAKARWEDTPKHPAYERPAPPPRRRNRRQQGAAQGATAGADTEQQQQTLRLF